MGYSYPVRTVYKMHFSFIIISFQIMGSIPVLQIYVHILDFTKVYIFRKPLIGFKINFKIN